MVDAAKHEVKKYFKRERNKKLIDGADYWDFDCKFGKVAEHADVVLPKEINKCIDSIAAEKLTSFYLEILAKPGYKQIPSEFDDDLIEE